MGTVPPAIPPAAGCARAIDRGQPVQQLLQLPGIQAHHKLGCAGCHALWRHILPKWQQLVQGVVLRMMGFTLAFIQGSHARAGCLSVIVQGLPGQLGDIMLQRGLYHACVLQATQDLAAEVFFKMCVATVCVDGCTSS